MGIKARSSGQKRPHGSARSAEPHRARRGPRFVLGGRCRTSRPRRESAMASHDQGCAVGRCTESVELLGCQTDRLLAIFRAALAHELGIVRANVGADPTDLLIRCSPNELPRIHLFRSRAKAATPRVRRDAKPVGAAASRSLQPSRHLVSARLFLETSLQVRPRTQTGATRCRRPAPVSWRALRLP